MLHYIIQVIFFQVLFLLMYDLFLSKETFFTKNRWYLIGTVMLSFVLPLLKIERLQKAVSEEYTVLLPEVVLSPQKVIEKTSWYQSVDYISVLFWIGVVVFSIVFIIKLTVVLKLIFTNEIRQKETYKLVLLPKTTKAFSFFNYIFLGKEIPKEKQEKIIQHELVHSQQNHSLDLLFFELLKIVMWFNPMLYVYQKRITLVHEFISDDIVSKSVEKNNYINNLLSEVFQVEHISFINQFYKHSFIKKRIIMITKTKSKQIKQLKYLLLVPVLASMLFYTACSSNETEIKKVPERYNVKIEKNGKFFYVVQDRSNKIICLDEEGNEVDLKSVLAKDFKMYDENNKDLSKIEETDVVPFTILDKMPTFPGCAEGDKDCFNKGMRQFVADNFDASKANSLGLASGKSRIYIKFYINKIGVVEGIKARAPHPELKKQVIEMVKKLPQFKPGEKDGKAVKTGYTIPITFNIQ